MEEIEDEVMEEGEGYQEHETYKSPEVHMKGILEDSKQSKDDPPPKVQPHSEKKQGLFMLRDSVGSENGPFTGSFGHDKPPGSQTDEPSSNG
jgi:hypothetical protein